VSATPAADGSVLVTGRTAEDIGEAAASLGVAVHELTPVTGSLEDAYLSLTQDEVEYRSDAEPAIEGAGR
jgi:ABC-2 type transport system ATP-binding protein